MTIQFVKGDLFSGDYDVIAHGVNCRGVMGAGIAKAFRAKFPEMYMEYARECQRGDLLPGEAMLFDAKPIAPIAGFNLATQENPGADATTKNLRLSLIGASYDLTVGLENGAVGTTFAMPLIGCGIGGLEYRHFIATLRSVNKIFPHIVYVVVFNEDNEHLVSPFDRSRAVDKIPQYV